MITRRDIAVALGAFAVTLAGVAAFARTETAVMSQPVLTGLRWRKRKLRLDQCVSSFAHPR
jgi:hypothetical protein